MIHTIRKYLLPLSCFILAHGFQLNVLVSRKSLGPLQGGVAREAKNHNNVMSDFETAFSVFCIGTALICNPAAAVSEPLPPLSSSVVVGAEIKVLDMSLPSYGAISNPNAADLESLKMDPPKEVTARIISKKESKSATKESSKKAKKTAILQKETDDDEKVKNLKIVDMSLPSYSDSTVGKGKEAFLL